MKDDTLNIDDFLEIGKKKWKKSFKYGDYNITNSGKTTVTASPPPVSDPDPADGDTTVAVDVDLSWHHLFCSRWHVY